MLPSVPQPEPMLIGYMSPHCDDEHRRCVTRPAELTPRQGEHYSTVKNEQFAPQQAEASVLDEDNVESLLDKLTTVDFNLVSDHILRRVNKSGPEKGDSALTHLAKFVFEKAKNEAAFSEIYARLCRKLVDQISPNIQDEAVQDNRGQPIPGGLLFRKHLTNLCQEHFERVLRHEATGTISKRQDLGLVRFIGELFVHNLLTERIVHECIKGLLSNITNPTEGDVENLCELLRTVGPSLDTPKARRHMDLYFERMREMANGSNVDLSIRFMLHDMVDLRQGWKTTQSSVITAARPPPKAGDLSQFGKISKSAGLSFGPTSAFNKDPKSHDTSLSRASSSMNPFALLIGAAGADGPPQSDLRGGVSSHRLGVGLGPGESPAVGRRARKRLNLLPGTKPTEIESEKCEDGGTFRATALALMSEADAQKRVKEDIMEYLGVENVEEAIMALWTLPVERRYIFVDMMVEAAFSGGNKTVILAENLFTAIHKEQVCSTEAFERGLLPTVEMADDLSIDVPKTYEWLARLMLAAGIERARMEELSGKITIYGEPRVHPRDLLIQELDKISA
ncbi:hypothetical protein FRC09_020972 [Ceratobasidium sp. 395]|nr:hypothetical protein FRC09_020972 [Ceratobasidium sp. 395]